MTVNAFITSNHKWLLEVATNVTATDPNAHEIRYDLLSFVTIIIIESNKYNDLEADDYKWLFAKFLKDNYRWKKGGAFWEHMGVINNNSNAHAKPIISDDDHIDILSDCAENCDEDLDLIKFYGDLNKDKIRHVRQFESNLPQHLKNLYDLYINQRLSIQQIANKIGSCKSEAFYLVDNLKKEILNSWNQSSLSLESPVSATSLLKLTSQTKLKQRLSDISRKTK